MWVNCEPLSSDRVPFANERELQRFVIDNAKKLLGVDVVSSTLRSGRPLHKIDILGVDGSGRLYVIECKHDAIDAGAIAQLRQYRDALVNDWTTVEERIASLDRGPSFRLANEPPFLVAIGYRCEATVADGARVERIVFKYPGRSFHRFVDSQCPGSVRLAVADDSDASLRPHRGKRSYAERHIASLPAKVRENFWAIDARLRKIDGIHPRYSGKNAPSLATYRLGLRTWISATVGPTSIIWRSIERTSGSPCSIDMGIETDANEVFETILRASSAPTGSRS